MNVDLRSARLDILSICTGGGGLDLGLELAIPGARAVCMVEREAFAIAHLVSAMEKGFLAPAPVWSDARTFDGRRWRGCVDGLIGGIPCQPHSLSGKRLGHKDERDLWSDTRRIFVQSGAWFLLIENVGGMLTTGGAERVWRDLGRLGVAREMGLFTAAEVGDSQERERVFILAVRDRERPSVDIRERSDPRAEFPAAAGIRWPLDGGACFAGRLHSRPGGEGEPAVDAGGPSKGIPTFPPPPCEFDRWAAIVERAPDLEPAVCRMADGLANRVDRLRLLGNGVVPLQAAYAFRTLATRLASAGSVGAGLLVRMMEAAE